MNNSKQTILAIIAREKYRELHMKNTENCTQLTPRFRADYT